MASKEATPAASAAPAEKKADRAAASSTFAFEFKLLKDKIGEKTTNKQVKSKVNDAFMGYGAFDECRVQGDVGQDRNVFVFFARLFGKGQPAWDSLQKGEAVTINIYDETVNLALSNEKPSGGGATTGTAGGPKKEGKKEGKKPRGDRKEGKDGEAKADGKAADGKDSKDGRPPRGPKKEEVKGPSLQRGRANIGGKLGPVSKIRLAKIEKEKKEKEKADKIAAGTWVEEKKEVEEDPSAHIVAPKAKGAKAEAGKKDAGKKEAGKKEAGKAEAGKKDAGAKKEGAKKGK